MKKDRTDRRAKYSVINIKNKCIVWGIPTVYSAALAVVYDSWVLDATEMRDRSGRNC